MILIFISKIQQIYATYDNNILIDQLQFTEDMIRILLSSLLLVAVFADCPLIPYPRKSIIGFLDAQLNNDPNLHGSPQEYIYALDQELQDGGVNVATGVVGLQFNPRGTIDFSIDYVPSTQLKSLKFLVQVTDPSFGWKSIRFNFFATQAYMFQATTQSVAQFSVGSAEGKYSVYRPIPNFNDFQVDPIIRVFLSGLKVKAKPLDDEYTSVVAQYENFKKFSTNAQLITYFSQAVQDKKAIAFKIVSAKILGRILNINIQANCDINSFKFSYVLFSQKVLTQKHNYLAADFFLINQNQYKFTPLQNMDMVFSGLTSLKTPRDQLYTPYLGFSNYLGQSYFQATTNFAYFGLGYSFFAFQMKQQFVCEDCPNSRLIYDNKFCVQECPRGFSQLKRLDNSYCDKCQIQKLKVVDTITFNCVCAKRHYLDIAQDTCKPCNYDCMTCDNADKCLTCDNSLLQTKRKLNSAGRCECPAVGYYDDKASEDIVCQKCSTKCLTCDGPRDHDCLTCSPSKQLDSRGFCVCKFGFVEDGQGNCVCIPPRQLSNNVCIDSTTPCGPNQVEQYIDLTRRCVCKSGFQQVLNDCIKCGKNSVFDANQLKCRCTNKTVPINGECVACEVNKVYEDLLAMCVCKSGTFKTDDGSCVTCPVKMAYINSKCQCIFNYFQVQPGVCSRCLRETDGPKCRRTTY